MVRIHLGTPLRIVTTKVVFFLFYKGLQVFLKFEKIDKTSKKQPKFYGQKKWWQKWWQTFELAFEK